MTPGQQAFADGFALTLSVHGQTFVRTADAANIVAVPSAMIDSSPHLPQAADNEESVLIADRAMIPTVAAASAMPVDRVKKGDELTKGSRKYRVVRADFREATNLWKVKLSPTF